MINTLSTDRRAPNRHGPRRAAFQFFHFTLLMIAMRPPPGARKIGRMMSWVFARGFHHGLVIGRWFTPSHRGKSPNP